MEEMILKGETKASTLESDVKFYKQEHVLYWKFKNWKVYIECVQTLTYMNAYLLDKYSNKLIWQICSVLICNIKNNVCNNFNHVFL